MSFTSAQNSKSFSGNPSYSCDVSMYRGVQRMLEYKFQSILYGEELTLALKTM